MTAGSSIDGRLLFVTGDAAAATARAAEIARQPGWTGRSAPTGLTRTAGAWLAGYDMGVEAGGGVAALADEPTFLAAARLLTDAPYLAAARADGAPRVVDVVPAGDDAVRVVRRLYPDALLLAPDEPLPALPELELVSAQPPAADPAQEDALIIVLGSGRSGTTWLHRLLTAHPAVAGTDTGETWLFLGAGRPWQAFHDDGAEGLAAWLDEADLLAATRACCDALLRAGRARLRPEATHFAEKTPAHVWRLPLLARLYPRAAYVHILRDGRDVALSWSNVPGSTRDLTEGAQSWVDAVRAIRATAPGLERFVEVRYEDLLDDPVAGVERVLTAIGVDVDDDFRRTAAERADDRVSPLASTGPVGTGKWLALDKKSRRAVQATAGQLLTELGYV